MLQIDIPFTLFSKYLVTVHMFEKLVPYYFMNGVNFFYNMNFKKIIISYTGKKIIYNKSNLILYFLYIFCLECISTVKGGSIFSKHTIPEFNIEMGQLVGFKVVLRRNRMYNFVFNYFYNNIINEKSFNGLILNLNSNDISLLIRSLYVFPEINKYFKQINDLYLNLQLIVSVNLCLNYFSLLSIFIYFSCLQMPLKLFREYQ